MTTRQSYTDYMIVHNRRILPALSSFSFFFLPDVLCDPTDLVWRKEIPFEAMTARTTFINDFLAEVFRAFPHLKGKFQEIFAQPPVSSHYHPYH